MNVIKRDGREVEFDEHKIIDAISKAGNVDDATKQRIADEIGRIKRRRITVEEIQNIVEKKLMSSQYKDVARDYINYRYLHNMARNQYAEFMAAVSEKLMATDVKNQNANVDEHSFGGRMGEANSMMMKRYALDYCMSAKTRENHESNTVYQHDLDSYAVGSHNCYERSTRFVTSDGIKSFCDFNDGDVATIITKDGTWRDAIVHCYGRQPMYEITLARCGITKTVVATRNHRWLLENGEFTDNIQINDRLYPLQKMEDINILTKRQADMFALGFILGDGYDHQGNLEVKFCTSEKERYIEIFDLAGYHISMCNGYKCARKKATISKQDFLNQKMWKILSFDDKRCLFRGYLAADGSKTSGAKYLWTSDDRMCDLIEDISALSGYHIFKKRITEGDTNYEKNRALCQYVFTTSYSTNSTWRVVSIKKGSHTNADYMAWCLEEPETHTFTLEGGVVTGNCLSFPIDKFLENGFNTRQTDVRPAQSVNTAFQLVAVLFQLQSLSQFGGVSATHIDWSMVPYVRKSFTKYIKEGFVYIERKPDFKTVKINEWLRSNGNHPDGLLHFDDEEFKNAHPEVWEYAMDMVEKETYQAVEGMYHNLNTLQSRSGNQLPFTSINYGTCTLPEGRMVTKALLDVSIKGIGKLHKTSIFPCGIFQYWKGINDVPGTPNYDLKLLALKSTAKRLYPNYVNCDWSNQKSAIIDDRNIKKDVIDSLTSKERTELLLRLKENDVLCEKLDLIIDGDNIRVDYDNEHPYEINSTMGCRTWNGSDINYGEVYKRNIDSVIETGTLKHPYFLSGAQKDGRGNICPATIILPTLAMEAIEMAENESLENGDYLDDNFVFECFMKTLDEKIMETKDSLIERFDWICSQDASSAKFMYENGSMEGYIPEEGIRSALKHGTLAIGQLGVAEALQAMFGCDQTTEKGMKYAIEIEKLFNKRCIEFKHKYYLNFGVYLTPAENLCFTAMTKFKEKYGVIKNVSDKKFFTNSVHVPVWCEMTPFEKIDIESKLNVYSNAGSITYTELDSSVSGNVEGLEKIVDFAMNNNIPYFAVNVPNDTCLECGYTGEFNDCCPVCGSRNIQRLRRVTGLS